MRKQLFQQKYIKCEVSRIVGMYGTANYTMSSSFSLGKYL